MKRYLFGVVLALALAATLDTCTYAPGLETAREAIEHHVRSIGPDVVPASMPFEVNELVQIDKHYWEVRLGAGPGVGAMRIRRSSEGWIVTEYIGETTLDLMASIAADQWLAQFPEVARFSSGSVTPTSSELTTGFRGDSWTSTYERIRTQLAIDHVLRP